MTKWIRLSVWCGVTTGLIFGLIMAMRFGLERGALSGLIVGIALPVVGIPIVFAVDALHRRGMPRQSSRVHQIAELRLDEPAESALHRVEAAIMQAGLASRPVKPETPTVSPNARMVFSFSGTTPPSLWSFGERITIDIEEGAAGSKVTVTSAPVVPTTAVDYGRNRRNVVRIVSAIEAQSPETSWNGRWPVSAPFTATR
jgi:hypothetical protein